MKIALTGSRGFIGSHLMKRLKEDGHEIVEWDLRNEPSNDVQDFNPHEISYVIHLAAHANVRQSIKDPQKYWVNNVENTTRIQKICTYNNIPLMYASSSCIHNWWLSPYGTTKKVNEETAFPHQVGLRFTTVYGEGARENMFIPMLLNGNLKYVTKHTRDFIHVKDVVEAITLLMSKDIRLLKPTYDIGTGIGHQVHSLADIGGYIDLPIVNGEECEAKDNTANNADLVSLGWKPTVKVDEYIVMRTVPH